MNVLVWGGVGSNKKKRTGCPEPSTEGRADTAHPQAPGAEAAVTVPKSFIFRNWMTASAFRYCKVCRYFRNHRGQWKIKVVGTDEGWKQTGKQDPTTTRRICYSVRILPRDLAISGQKLSWKLQPVKITRIQDLHPTAPEVHLPKTSSDIQHS